MRWGPVEESVMRLSDLLHPLDVDGLRARKHSFARISARWKKKKKKKRIGAGGWHVGAPCCRHLHCLLRECR